MPDENKIEARHRDNDWHRNQTSVRNAKQSVGLQFWPYAGHQRDGGTARLSLRWATIDTSDREPVVLPEVCLLLTLDEMRWLRDKATAVVRDMEELANDEGYEETE